MTRKSSESQSAKDIAYKFILAKHAAALATIDDQGRPHSVTVHILVHKNLDIYFTSSSHSRKFRNLNLNPIVAMSISDEQSMTTVQLSGYCHRVEQLDEEQKILSELWRLRFKDSAWPLPTMQLYESGAVSNIVVLKVVPFEMTYANFSVQTSGKYKSFFRTII